MRREFLIALGLGLLAPGYATAQESEVAFIATYYQCSTAREARADTIIREVAAPIFDRHVAAGNLTAWGWIAHNTGGKWRRALYYAASDRDQLLDSRAMLIEELLSEHGAATRELNAICPTHDDYIWSPVAASQPSDELGQERGSAGFSTYYECDITREARADSLVMEKFAPIFNRHVSEGNINSWAWHEHQVGGKLRRLFVLDGADHKSLLDAREALIQDIGSAAPEAGAEFSRICGVHYDYMWDIQIARP